MSDKEKRVIAYHESGHALVGHVLPDTDPIHKVSIIARGRALGWTLALPTEDRFLQTRSELRDELAMLLGGRTAEELIFGDPTTGAANDIERATEIARAMVTEYGMSDRLGPRKLGEERNAPFLGRDLGHEPNYSDEVAASIDAEVRRLLDEAHIEAREILELHRATLDRLADALDRARDPRGVGAARDLRRRRHLELGQRDHPRPGPACRQLPRSLQLGHPFRASPRPAEAFMTELFTDGHQPLKFNDRPAVDLPRIDRAVREILEAIGEDPERDGLRRHAHPGGPHVRRDLQRAPRGSRASTCRSPSRRATTR